MTVINYELPSHTVRRHNRRKQFFNYFTEKVPLGVFDVKKLAKDCCMAERTVIHFLAILRKTGLAQRKIARANMNGMSYYRSVWSKVSNGLGGDRK